MTTRSVDTKLARRLQQRNKWDSYSSCLREVRKFLETNAGLYVISEIKAKIDIGELDPKRT